MSTHQLVCCSVSFWAVRSAGCWSWWCPRLCQTLASKPSAELHTTCDTAGDASPENTHAPPRSAYTYPSYEKHRYTTLLQCGHSEISWAKCSHFNGNRCNDEFHQMEKKYAYAFTFFIIRSCLLAFACEIMQSNGKCDHNFRHRQTYSVRRVTSYLLK